MHQKCNILNLNWLWEWTKDFCKCFTRKNLYFCILLQRINKKYGIPSHDFTVYSQRCFPSLVFFSPTNLHPVQDKERSALIASNHSSIKVIHQTHLADLQIHIMQTMSRIKTWSMIATTINRQGGSAKLCILNSTF